MITAGPATGIASLSTKKMPVPTVAPTPNIMSWNVPSLRGSRAGMEMTLEDDRLRRSSWAPSPRR